MLNTEQFVKRINQMLEHYRISAATFADTIQVQRSSISHLLSGRNKPSLEFVLKIVEAYKEVTLDWLLYGKDSFPFVREEKKAISSSQKELNFNTEEPIAPQLKSETKTTTTDLQIEKIVVFYKNGTFKKYVE